MLDEESFIVYSSFSYNSLIVQNTDFFFRKWSTPCPPKLLTTPKEEMDTIWSTYSRRFSQERHARMMISSSCQVCSEIFDMHLFGCEMVVDV